ncbi:MULTISPECIES: helix-turn-helix transcriptional regulator [unclassified Sphingobium]|uniref:helix-turn-helix transcriptional regulator n=1 Tax=unclassified Sphingobium TaxID=2611147 RepID=UPI0035A5E52D
MKGKPATLEERAILAFAAAPFEPDEWDEALTLLGQVCGGWTAQLLMVDAKGDIRVNRVPLMPADAVQEWERRGGAIPSLNPRAPALFAPALSISCDDDVLPREEQEASPFYRELFDPFDARFLMVGTLPPTADQRSVAAVLRTRRQDHPQQADKEVMAKLLPHVQAAVKLQRRLNDRDVRLAMDSADLLGLTVFLCDRAGRVVACSAAAESLVEAGDMLCLRYACLKAALDRQDEALQGALRRATRRFDDSPVQLRGTTLALTDAAGRACRVDVAPVPPGAFHFFSDAACIVHVTLPRSVAEPRHLLMQAFGLSPAEAAVALDLASGMTANEIAAGRGVSTETVRAQVRAVLQKTGVSKATALATLIGRFNL